MLQIGFATQVAAVMLFVGIYLAARPYNIAKWHGNDEATQQRLHKREQKHKKKDQRSDYQSRQGRIVEPSQAAVTGFRILGIALIVIGALIGMWSLGVFR